MDISYYKNMEPIFGSWHIVRLLGEGSFGKVFEIEREDFGKKYKSALKVITIPSSEGEVKSLKAEGMDDISVTSYYKSFVTEVVNEFAVMSELSGNSNIVSYEDHMVIEHKDTVGWDILIRMELLTPLIDYTANHPMGEKDIIKLGMDLCKALELCKRKKLLHRDIKPENIFVSKNGDYKLGDFGVARTAEKTTSGLSKKGTYAYMAPEVYLNKPYGSTVDIYSVGLVLYKMLNRGRGPFLPPIGQPISFSDKENSIARRMRGEDVPAPVDGSEELKRIVLKACSYDSDKRYHEPEYMREELEKLFKSYSNVTLSQSSISENGDERTASGFDTKDGMTVKLIDSQTDIEETVCLNVYDSDETVSLIEHLDSNETVSLLDADSDMTVSLVDSDSDMTVSLIDSASGINENTIDYDDKGMTVSLLDFKEEENITPVDIDSDMTVSLIDEAEETVIEEPPVQSAYLKSSNVDEREKTIEDRREQNLKIVEEIEKKNQKKKEEQELDSSFDFIRNFGKEQEEAHANDLNKLKDESTGIKSNRSDSRPNIINWKIVLTVLACVNMLMNISLIIFDSRECFIRAINQREHYNAIYESVNSLAGAKIIVIALIGLACNIIIIVFLWKNVGSIFRIIPVGVDGLMGLIELLYANVAVRWLLSCATVEREVPTIYGDYDIISDIIVILLLLIRIGPWVFYFIKTKNRNTAD